MADCVAGGDAQDICGHAGFAGTCGHPNGRQRVGASTSGIGYRIQNAQIMFLLTDMWCGIILLALIGYTLNLLFLKFERRVLAWHRGARGRTAT